MKDKAPDNWWVIKCYYRNWWIAKFRWVSFPKLLIVALWRKMCFVFHSLTTLHFFLHIACLLVYPKQPGYDLHPLKIHDSDMVWTWNLPHRCFLINKGDWWNHQLGRITDVYLTGQNWFMVTSVKTIFHPSSGGTHLWRIRLHIIFKTLVERWPISSTINSVWLWKWVSYACAYGSKEVW